MKFIVKGIHQETSKPVQATVIEADNEQHALEIAARNKILVESIKQKIETVIQKTVQKKVATEAKQDILPPPLAAKTPELTPFADSQDEKALLREIVRDQKQAALAILKQLRDANAELAVIRNAAILFIILTLLALIGQFFAIVNK